MKETLIQNAPLFSVLSPEEQQLLADAMQEHSYPKGYVLYAQAQPLDELYLIKAGWVKLTTVVAEGRSLVTNLAPGSLLGEMDMLLGQAATSSAQAVGEITVWSLSRADLDKILFANPSVGLKFSAALGKRMKSLDHYLVQHRLRRMEMFAALEDHELLAMAEHLQPIEVRRGGLIFRAGAASEMLFVIESGDVILTSAREDASEPFRQLQAGALIGEMSVLTGKPYDAMARAGSDAVLWGLHRKDFTNLTTQYPNIRAAMSLHLSQTLSLDDQASAKQQLAKLPLFVGMSETVINAVSSALILRHYPARETIFKPGDPSDALLIVDSGEVQIEGESREARVVASGGYFGEMALLMERNRTYRASTTTDSNIWLLYQSDFDELQSRFPQLGTALSAAVNAQSAAHDKLYVNQQLRKFGLFSQLNDVELADVAQAMHPQVHKRGEIIYAEGQPGDAMYFVESGEVQIATRTGVGVQLAFELLHIGEFFGEMALLSEGVRKSTARAAERNTQLWVLQRSAFNDLINLHPQLALALSKAVSEKLARTDTRPTPPPQLRQSPAKRAIAPSARPAAPRPSTTPTARRTAAKPMARPAAKAATPLAVRSQPVTHTPQNGARPSANGHQSRVAVPGRPVPARPIPMRALVPVVQPRSQPNGLVIAAERSADWMMSRSLGFKFRFAALTLLFIWLCGIAAPVTVFSAMSSNEGRNFVASLLSPSDDSGPNADPSRPRRQATFTPTAPATNTPKPGETPKPPTVTPTNKPVVAQVVPTNTPVRARATNTSVPTPEAKVPVPLAAPEPDYKLIKLRQLTPCENQGGHHFHVLVVDKNGNGVPNVQVEFIWDSGVVRDQTGKKVENIPALEVTPKNTAGYVIWPIYKGRARAKVVSGSSDVTDWVTVDLPDQRCDKNDNPIANSLFHYSYMAVFQKTR